MKKEDFRPITKYVWRCPDCGNHNEEQVEPSRVTVVYCEYCDFIDTVDNV